MMFKGRFEQARQHQQEQMDGSERAYDDENISNKLEKNDTLAMILSALMVFLPAALIVLGVVSLLGYLFIVR